MAIAKTEGLLPKLSEESLWQELRSSRHTTPIMREWMPWLMEWLMRQGCLTKLHCFQCESGRLSVDSDVLDEAVSEGIKTGALTIL